MGSNWRASSLRLRDDAAVNQPVQLHWLTAVFGGYDVARVVHLSALVLLVGFAATHLVLVVLHPRTIIDMIAGGRRG